MYYLCYVKLAFVNIIIKISDILPVTEEVVSLIFAGGNSVH